MAFRTVSNLRPPNWRLVGCVVDGHRFVLVRLCPFLSSYIVLVLSAFSGGSASRLCLISLFRLPCKDAQGGNGFTPPMASNFGMTSMACLGLVHLL